MGKGKKTGGRNFQKGNKLAVGHGRPPVPLEIKEFRKATKTEITEEFKYLWSLTETELEYICKHKDEESGDTNENMVPIVRKFIAKALLNAVKTGNMLQINSILDRVIGKVKEEIEHTGTLNVHSQIVDIINNIEKDNE